MPFGVAKPGDAQHRVGVGRNQGRQRPNIARQVKQGGELPGNEGRRPELRKQDAADPYATLVNGRLGQDRLDVMLRLTRISVRVAKHNARMEEMFVATRRNQGRCPHPIRGHTERAPDVDRCVHVGSFFNREHFYSLRKLTVASVNRSSCYANIFVAEWVQPIFTL